MELVPIEESTPEQFEDWAVEQFRSYDAMLKRALAAHKSEDYEKEATEWRDYLSSILELSISMGKRVKHLEGLLGQRRP